MPIVRGSRDKKNPGWDKSNVSVENNPCSDFEE
jgi:hypothetical protein